MIESQRCAELVYSRAGWGGPSRCERTGKLLEDGEWWCRTHAPSCVAARHAKKEAEWSRAAAQREAADRRRAAYKLLCDEVFALMRRIHVEVWLRPQRLDELSALTTRLAELDAEHAKAGGESNDQLG